ncbi:M20 metallopeptidase family protein [Macrococcoides bohemicum]|uniref:M20 metallopeptidase family protein n=1 Tax=Macrococcoides bohemicum TaxID=1903056 RepID=UPI00165E74AC|nr:amidohydrolase [Macrococcus bohemicus]MBC9873406.1 amidohydrolase [Macrococcus bohemicus]
MINLDNIINTRRTLHQYPELGLEEHHTTAYIIKRIQSLGIEYFTPLETGVIAIIKGSSNETIAFRADIDALPIEEQNDIEYKSKVPHVMHACGHDGHTTMLIAFMEAVNKISRETPLTHNIMFIFQPSEEANAGANLLIQNFNFEAYNIKAIYGIHMMPDHPEGEMIYRSHEITASATEYRFFINGKSAHVANKEQGHAASNALIQVLNQVSTLQQFYLPGLERNIIHIGKFNAGEAINTVPSSGYLEGTIRTYRAADLNIIQQQMEHIAQAVSLTTHCEVNVEFSEGYPPTINDSSLEDKVVQSIAQSNLVGVKKDVPYLFGEDFSFYRILAPTYFVFLGCRNEQKGYVHGLHHNQFNFDEKVLLNGINYYLSLVRGYEDEC